MFLFSSSPFPEFDALVEEATSELIPAAREDITRNMEICDQIKSRQVPAKDALRTIKARFAHHNPNVHILTLQLLDTCTKNAGKQLLVEMASREFCEEMQRLTRDPNINMQVQEIAKEYLQKWALLLHAVDPVNLSFMREAYLECKRAGVHFPTSPKHVDASVVDTNGPPEWSDSPVCVRCRTEFGFYTRQHHCRRCGKSYCHPCSSREMPLPEYGLPEPVRVCEPCYFERTNGQIKREPIPVHMPGEPERVRTPLDPDVEEAVKMSLMEDQLRQARMASTAAEEEAQIAAAIAESLRQNRCSPPIIKKEELPPPMPKISVSPTEKEKEMVSLFGKLVLQMLTMSYSPTAKSSDLDVEEDMRGTFEDIKSLQNRILEKVPEKERSSELLAYLDSIDDAILDFEDLQVRKEKLLLKEKYPTEKEEKKVAPIQFPPLPDFKRERVASPGKKEKKGKELVPE